MAKRDRMVEEAEWPALVCGVVVRMVGDGQGVTVYAKRVSRADAVRLVDVAWNKRRLWPHCPWVASVDFSVHECADEPDTYDVTMWAGAES